MAMQGASVVVNDLAKGGGTDAGTRAGANQEKRLTSDADAVVAEIILLGGKAAANYDDVSSWEGAERMVNQAVETFGDLNVLICNAGILRDRTMLNMTEAEWDLVFQVRCEPQGGASSF